MSQLSRPYQIALGALLVFALAWFTVLKPSDDAAAEPLPGAGAAVTAPGAAGLGNAVAGAQGAADVSAASAAETSAAASAASGEVPAGAATAPASTSSTPAGATGSSGASGSLAALGDDPSAPMLRDVARGRVAVVLFYDTDAYDDRAVRRALVAADRHGGKVAVHPVPIARVAEYTAITEGVDVTQAPTLLVIGKQNRARQIVGFTDTRAIDQLVADVGGTAFAPRRFKGYRAKVSNLCAVAGQGIARTAPEGESVVEWLGVMRSELVDVRRSVRRLEAPPRYRAFQRALVTNLDGMIDVNEVNAKAAAAGGGDARAELVAAGKRLETTSRRLIVASERAGLDC